VRVSISIAIVYLVIGAVLGANAAYLFNVVAMVLRHCGG